VRVSELFNTLLSYSTRTRTRRRRKKKKGVGKTQILTNPITLVDLFFSSYFL
jgi:hypothetical protein